MTFQAHVHRVLIASPSDTGEARNAVERAISDWNNAFAESRSTAFLAWRYEKQSVPALGAHPQSLINSQGVDKSDVVIAMFGAVLGTATPEALSGTVEEIERAAAQGKPVHVNFSNEPIPRDVDIKKLEEVRGFKATLKDRGLYGEYDSPHHLAQLVSRALDHDVDLLVGEAVPMMSGKKSGVDFLVQPQSEREQKGLDKRGTMKYTSRHWIDVTNRGDTDAENVTFSSSSSSVHTGDEPTTIHAGQVRKVYRFMHMGVGSETLSITWTEDGEEQSKEFHLG